MFKKKIALLSLVSIISNFSLFTTNVLAYEIKENSKKIASTEVIKKDSSKNKKTSKAKKVITVAQNGNTHAKARDNLKMTYFGTDYQSTGIVAKPGEEFVVYVQAEENVPLPTIAFSQHEGFYSNWVRWYQLKPGKNVTITVNVRPIQYIINLDLQEGTGTTTTIYGSVENLPVLPNDNPEKQGYNFKGWFDAPTKGTVITMDNLNTASNMLALFGNNTELTIYAQYTEVGNFVVIYSAVGADEETIPTDNTQYNIAETSIIKIPNQEPKKLGYTFEGWKTGTDDTVYKYGTQNDTYTVPNDISGAITFIAQWSINEYKITYELNGGINAENAPVSYTIETDTITLPVPTKDGYNFEGWYTDAAFENAVAAIAKGSVGDMVLYAKWSEKDMAVYKINSYEKGNVSVRKRTDTDDSSSVVIVAFYKTLNNNSVLIKTSIAEIGAIEKGDDISKTVEEPEDYSYAKVFMWNDLNGMMPRCNSLKMDK